MQYFHQKLTNFFVFDNDKKYILSEEENTRYKSRITKVKKKIDKLNSWIENNEDKKSLTADNRRGGTIQSSITDNDSAKMQLVMGMIIKRLFRQLKE